MCQLICFVLSVLFLSMCIYVGLVILPIRSLTHLSKIVTYLTRLNWAQLFYRESLSQVGSALSCLVNHPDWLQLFCLVLLEKNLGFSACGDEL